jgi:hypothetical protein
MRYWFILPIIVLASVCLVASEGLAQLPGQENAFTRSERVWKLRDVCARTAQKQFPDHTAEGNAKRESSYRKCLEANNLPYEPSASTEKSGSSRH